MHGAAGYGYTEALRELLSADAHVSFNSVDDMSRTPLICAVQNGHLAEAALLLEAGADANAHDAEKIGDTALSHAVLSGNLRMVQLLLKHHADPNITGWMQLSALDRARDAAANDAAPESRPNRSLLR